MTTVIGIDPGANETGIIVRQGQQPIKAWIVERENLADPEYVIEVIGTLQEAEHDLENSRLISVEGLIAPDKMPWLGRKNIDPLIRTAIVLGAVLAAYPGAVVVQPGGHGKGPMSTYPQQLRPLKGSGKGFDILRHCRSAWDISIVGEMLCRRGGQL